MFDEHLSHRNFLKKEKDVLPGWSVPRSLGSVVLGPGHIAPAVVPAVGGGGTHGGGPGQALVAAAVVARVGAVVWVNSLGPATEQISTESTYLRLYAYLELIRWGFLKLYVVALKDEAVVTGSLVTELTVVVVCLFLRVEMYERQPLVFF